MAPLPGALRLPPHRSLLHLAPGSRLLGLDPERALAVDDLPPPLAQMLDELVDPVPTEQLVDRAVARGARRDAALRLLTDLVAAGAVVDAAGTRRQEQRRAESTVVVEGAGPLAVGVVLGLAAAGVRSLHVVTSGVVLAADLGTGYVDADRGQDRASATAAALARLFPRAGTGAPPQRTVPDLVVLTDTGPEPQRLAALHADRTAHLAVRLRDGVGVVGPLVLPGRSTCLSCLEVGRRAADRAWTAVAAQLVGRTGRADPACVVATAGLATAQALAALDDVGDRAGPPSTLDAVLELDAAAGSLARHERVPEPECGCGAARSWDGTRPGDMRDRRCSGHNRRVNHSTSGPGATR